MTTTTLFELLSLSLSRFSFLSRGKGEGENGTNGVLFVFGG